MEIRFGFTITAGPEGWQFPPMSFLKVYKTGENVSLEDLKSDLQAIMDFSESKLSRHDVASKDDALAQILLKLSEQKQLPGK